MGYTNRQFPVMEVAVSCFHGGTLASGHKRVRNGDIVTVRPPGQGIGLKEIQSFLWFRAEGLEENEWFWLTEPLYVTPSDDPTVPEAEEIENKRRFTVDLNRIVELYPWVDLNRIADLQDPYQPLMPVDFGAWREHLENRGDVDEETGLFVDLPVPIVEIAEVVFDRQTIEYLDPDLLREVKVG